MKLAVLLPVPRGIVNSVTVGEILRLLRVLTVPVGVVTDRGPVVAVGGTTAVMNVLLTTLKLVAGTDPNLTAVAPVRTLPRMSSLGQFARDPEP